MNENIKNMVEELKEKYPDDYGHFEGLTIDKSKKDSLKPKKTRKNSVDELLKEFGRY